MKEASAKLERNEKTRMEILEEFLQEECVSTCSKKWLTITKDTFQRNDISQKPLEIFSSKVVENIATSCLKGLQMVGGHSSLIH